MTRPRVRLGELLVEAQIITREKLEGALGRQSRDGRRLGSLLVEEGLVTETQVTQILSQQLSVPWVSLYHIDFSRQLLNLVSRELAEQHCVVPIFVRRLRGQGETLYLAMDDPGDDNVKRQISQYAGLPVRAMIAPPSDIQAAIRAYYGAGSSEPALAAAREKVETVRATGASNKASESAQDEADRATQPIPEPVHEFEPDPVTLPRPAASARAGAGKTAPAIAGPPQERSGSEPEIQARETTMPAPRRGAPARMVTLTLLDGTKINLPATAARGSAKAEHRTDADQLTARDLVAALRAVAHGADASEILGENVHWEALFAALLSVLLKKHLIADWEFVDEYNRT
jgi:type IV pilus assembly protein PilB